MASEIELNKAAIALREVALAKQSDDTVLENLKERFMILREMSKAVKAGNIKGLIVSGPPGIGKSFSVFEEMAKSELLNMLADRKIKYEVLKGNISSLGLYAKLYEFSKKGEVLILDDSDEIFTDSLTLNILTSALDSSEHRWISWNTDSRMLRTEGIPNTFEFCGSVIFITNIKFAHVRSKKLRDHLAALESRCHYIDLEIDTVREKMLWVKHVVSEGMLDVYDFADGVKESILDFVTANQHKLREISLRTVLKVADLRKSFPSAWEAMARTTVMKK